MPFHTQKSISEIIIFADILEHLRFPDKVLIFFKECLKDDGYIIISMPNVANWTIRLKLFLVNGIIRRRDYLTRLT